MKVGKVRNVYDIGNNLLSIECTNRQSAFDRFICNIPYKGYILTDVSTKWFNLTQGIIPNHMVFTRGNHMIVKKTTPFKLEVIVRRYLTGNTKTSLWTHYKDGCRNYCGNILPDGLTYNHRFAVPLLTPTTKGDEDIPISPEEITRRGYASQEEWDYISRKALELFEFGECYALTKGLVLVDTKYEFGKDVNGEIILIDELHTCDSSRYWFDDGTDFQKNEPKKFDKDLVRDYVKKNYPDPYSTERFDIPEDVIRTVLSAYRKFHSLFCEEYPLEHPNGHLERYFSQEEFVDLYYQNFHPTVVIYSGSPSDDDFVQKIKTLLKERNIYCEHHVLSAHKKTKELIKRLDIENSKIKKEVNICVAGMSCALGAVVSYNSKFPTINCPPYKDNLDFLTNVNSCVVNPSDIDVLFIMNPKNVVKAVQKILNL